MNTQKVSVRTPAHKEYNKELVKIQPKGKENDRQKTTTTQQGDQNSTEIEIRRSFDIFQFT